jgi:hypothetical protein
MSWDDDDFEIEYAKFKKADLSDDAMCTHNTHVLYCEVLWNTIDDYRNQWNKKRKKVRVNPIILAKNTPREDDFVDIIDNLYLDMGSRLFTAMKKVADKKPKYVKILKEIDPNDKFDVRYEVFQYKLSIQKQITKSKAKK